MELKPRLRVGIDTGTELIKPSQMSVDMTYQRDPRQRSKRISEIVKNYDRRLLGVFHVVRRKDGSIWIVDGAGRQLAMAKVGDDEPVNCVVHYHIKSVEEEADWFLRLNPDCVARVNASQKFKARLAANDKQALAIHTAAIKGGLLVTGTGKNSISVQAASCLYDLGNLTRVGFIKKAAWEPHKAGGVEYVALGATLFACPGMNEERLRRTLQENPPKVLHAATLAEYGATGITHARDAAAKTARMIVKLYNYHASAHRVTPNWRRVDVQLQDHHYDKWRSLEE